jgi:hypothetical protein
MRNSKKLVGLIAVAVMAAACTDNSIFNPVTDAEGTYTLTVYAGKSMPATYTIQPNGTYPNGATFVVNNGTLVLDADGTFTETNNYTTTPNGGTGVPSSFVSSGTWTLNGTQFSLFAPPQNNFPARSVSGTLDLDANGVATVNYQEDDGTGTGNFESFEYKR